MQFDYGLELSKRKTVQWLEESLDGYEPEKNSMQFLLTCAPLLAKYEQAKSSVHHADQMIAHPLGPCSTSQVKALQQCVAVHQEFKRLYSSDSTPRQDPSVCPRCNSPSQTFVNASYVCTECGVVNPDRVAKNGGLSHDDQQNRNTSGPYKYDPRVYFQKRLDEVQGIHKGPIPKSLVGDIRRNLRRRKIKLSDVDPDIIRAALRRLKEPRYYPCRWALAKKINPSYEPITISEHAQDQINGLFQGMMERLPRIVKKLRIPRKNLTSYPSFAHQGFLFLGYPEYAKPFEPLKSDGRRQLQDLMLHMVFSELGHSEPHPCLPPKKSGASNSVPKPPPRTPPSTTIPRRRKTKRPRHTPVKAFRMSWQERRVLRHNKVRKYKP